jgi:hypothetical protein
MAVSQPEPQQVAGLELEVADSLGADQDAVGSRLEPDE